MGEDRSRERLRRAVALAAKGRFAVEPNPLVGCVLERDGAVVGEGWHTAYGGPHAEVEAIARAGEAARGATAWVSLQPCSRHGKTPPCTEALLRAGVVRAVYAEADPAEPQGVKARVARAGLTLEGPVLPGEGAPLLAAHLRARARARPWTILKWAMSVDGRIAPRAGAGGVLASPQTLAFVHDLRAHVDAVLVGVRTVAVDDPRLTCRLAGGPPHGRAQPLRVVLDPTLRTGRDAALFRDVPEAGLLLITISEDAARRSLLEEAGAGVVVVSRTADGGIDLHAAMLYLYGLGVRRLLVEGGARTHGAFLRAGLADQVTAVVAPRVLGHEGAPPAVDGSGFDDLARAPRLEAPRWRRLGDDLVFEGYVPASAG